MPGNELSTEPVKGAFLPPDDRPFNTMEDFEYGGIAHQDPSQGLLYQIWRVVLAESGIATVQPENESQSPISVMTQAGAEYISLAFDSNMNMTLAWALGSDVTLYWFDSTVEGFVTTTFQGCACPRLSHDDKREGAGAWSDVMFAYLRDGSLYTRMQRDRYSIETLQAEAIENNLTKLGMNVGLRLQFEV